MKRTFWILLALVLLFVVPTVFAQGETPPLTIEQFPWLGVLLVGAVTFIVTAGLKSLSATFGVDLSGKASAITAAIVLALIEIINTTLSTIPPTAIPSVTAGITFLFTLFSAFGFAGLLKKITTKQN